MRQIAFALLCAAGVVTALVSEGEARAEAAGWICEVRWGLADSPVSPLAALGLGARIPEYRWYVRNCTQDERRRSRALRIIADYENRERSKRQKKRKATQPNPATPAAPSPVPSELPPAVPPPPSQPVPKDVATLDDDEGGGDVRTLTEALELVRDGGTIRIRPGRYAADLFITKSVKLVGEHDSPPILVGSIVSAGKDVTLDTLKLESRHQTGTLRLDSGGLRVVNCLIQNNGGVAMDSVLTPAVSVSAGQLEFEGGVIGPGRDAAILVAGNGKVSIHGQAKVRGVTGYGIYATDNAEVDIGDAQVSGTIAVVTSGRTNLWLADSDLIGIRGRPVVSLSGQTVAEILNNQVSISAGDDTNIAAERSWVRVTPSVSHRIEDNTTAGSRRLPAPKPQGVPSDSHHEELRRRPRKR